MTINEYIEELRKRTEGTEITVKSTSEIPFESEPEGTEISGIMYSDDEMWENDIFYTELISEGKIFRCYYKVEDDQELCDVDYTKPLAIADISWQFEKEDEV